MAETKDTTKAADADTKAAAATEEKAPAKAPAKPKAKPTQEDNEVGTSGPVSVVENVDGEKILVQSLDAASKGLSEGNTDAVSDDWVVSTTDDLGRDFVTIRPTGWVGDAPIRTSLEKAKALGKALAKL